MTLTGLSLTGADANNYTVTGNLAATTANITPATITGLGGLSVATKTYDGTTSATLNTGGVTFAGRIGSDDLTLLSGSANFADKNAGTGKAVSLTGVNLGGADARNYVFAGPTSATLTGDITPAQLTLTGLTAASRVYDATTNATLTSTGTLNGLVAGETLNLQITGAAFADKNAGTNKTVAVTGYVLGDGTGLARNYQFNGAGLRTTADITPATIAAITGITAADKLFDGTTTALLDSGGAVFNGLLGSDALTVRTATGAFDTSTPGVAKTVNISGLSLGGADAGNYVLASTTAQASASITQPVPVAIISTIVASTQAAANRTASGLPGQSQMLTAGGYGADAHGRRGRGGQYPGGGQ